MPAKLHQEPALETTWPSAIVRAASIALPSSASTAAPDGSETIVPYTMVGDRAVVQTAARSFIHEPTYLSGIEPSRVLKIVTTSL